MDYWLHGKSSISLSRTLLNVPSFYIQSMIGSIFGKGRVLIYTIAISIARPRLLAPTWSPMSSSQSPPRTSSSVRWISFTRLTFDILCVTFTAGTNMVILVSTWWCDEIIICINCILSACRIVWLWTPRYSTLACHWESLCSFLDSSVIKFSVAPKIW